MKIIENRTEFNTFIKEFNNQASILVPIPVDHRRHQATNELCLMGVCELFSGEMVILPFNHPEANNLPPELMKELADGLEIWTPDAKLMSFFINQMWQPPLWEPIGDIQSLEYLATGNVTDPDTFYSPVIRHTHERHRNEIGVNQAIPLYKWAEFVAKYCEHLCRVFKEHSDQTISDGYKYLIETAIPSLQWVEESGLHVDPEKLREHFTVDDRFITNDLVHSQYNLFTATGRPSCRFGGINFAALKKNSGEREVFTSRFSDGMLVNIDFESYHVRLIANHIGYTLPAIPAHEYFGRYYFGTKKLTDEQYEESKIHTFKLLYSSEPSDIPFFAKVAKFKEQLWDDIQRDGEVRSPITGKLIKLDHIWEPRPAKVFNYFVQFMETEQNLKSLSALQKLFEWKKSKIILYNYDSFLIDYSMSDGGDLLLDVVNYLEQGKKFPVRIKAGKNYDEMSFVKIER